MLFYVGYREEDNMEVGDRVWANIPGTGYVGVGEVVGDICRAENYQFGEFENKTIPLCQDCCRLN